MTAFDVSGLTGRLVAVFETRLFAHPVSTHDVLVVTGRCVGVETRQRTLMLILSVVENPSGFNGGDYAGPARAGELVLVSQYGEPGVERRFKLQAEPVSNGAPS